MSARVFEQGQIVFVSDIYGDDENSDAENDESGLHRESLTSANRKPQAVSGDR